MEKDQAGIATNSSFDHSAGQEPTSTAVEEYLHLAQGSPHLGFGKDGVNGNSIALFKDVKVWGVDAGLTYQETVASQVTSLARFFYSLLSHKKSTKKVILHGINGIVREGEMLLVLNRPGGGSTTLLKTLAGMTESFHGWSGIINFFDIPINVIKKSYRGDVVYSAEGSFFTRLVPLPGRSRLTVCSGDVHFPYLTVMNTLGFAVETKTPRSGLKRSQQSDKVKVLTDTILRVFGMELTRNTLVGNEFVAGVSGGERKRVSLAEVVSDF